MTKTELPGGLPAITQQELQAVLDAWNRVEILAAGIRRRLDRSATVEHGKLGVSTTDDTLSDYAKDGIGTASHVGVLGLNIAPQKRISQLLAARQ
jgi:hypothetical protein